MRFWSAGAFRAASMAKRGAAGVISRPPSAAWSYHAGMKGHVSSGSGRPGLKSIGLSNRIEYSWSGVQKGIILHQINAAKSSLEWGRKKLFGYIVQNAKNVFLHLYNMFFAALVFNGVKFWLWDIPNKEKQDVASAAMTKRLKKLEDQLIRVEEMCTKNLDQLIEVKEIGTKNLAKLEEMRWMLAGQVISIAVVGFIAWFTVKP